MWPHGMRGIAVMALGCSVLAAGLFGVSRLHSGASRAQTKLRATAGDPTSGIAPGQPVEPPPKDLRPVASPDEAAQVLAVLATDPTLDRIGVPEARNDAAAAKIYDLGDNLFDAYVPLEAEREFDSVVPVYVGAAFGVDPPEVRQATLAASGVTALHAWVDTANERIVQIDTNGFPTGFAWIGKPPPKEPGD